jgi:hypothetical protein
MSCQDFEILINRDLDGVIDSADQKRLAAHVSSCARCAAEQASLQTIHGAFRDLRHVDVRPGLAETIVARATAPRGSIFQIPRHALIPAAAAVLALCAISGALGWRLREDPFFGGVKADRSQVRDEAPFRQLLADKLALPADQVDAIIRIRRDYDQKRDAAQTDHRDQLEKLQKTELEEIWKLLPADARERYLDIDRTFTPPR